MQPFKRIILLSTIVAGIVLFWLMPGLNKAKGTRYTRIYEDTETRAYRNRHDTLQHLSEKKEKQTTQSEVANKQSQSKKVYKKESIKANAQMRDIKPSMFSRAIHFREEIIPVDTVGELSLTEKDTLIQYP